MIPKVAEHGARENRREPRTNMFVMATLYFVAHSAPVRLRDMSPAGALIEGAGIPEPGTKIRLCRGTLNVGGEVVWINGGKAGLRFYSSVSVADWLPSGRAAAPQQRVDEIVQQVKRSSTTPAESRGPLLTLSPSEVSALDLMRLRRAIEALAEDLADDPGVVQRHGPRLQTLDIAAQILGKLAARA